MKYLNLRQIALVLMMSCGMVACNSSDDDNGSPGGNGGSGGSNGGGGNDDSSTPQEISSNISSATTWDNKFSDPSKNDYVVKSNSLNVKATLTIKPGVRIQMPENGEIYIKGQGALDAQGTSNKPILFTGKVPTKGYWRGISINSPSDQNKLKYVTMRYGGAEAHYWDGRSILWVRGENNTKLALENCTLAESAQHGLAFGKNVTMTSFSNNQFKNNKMAGLWVDASELGQLDTKTDYNNGNGKPYVKVFCNKVTENQTWKNINTYYLLSNSSNNLNINADLIIEAGTDFKATKKLEIYVNAKGSINAVGKSGKKITFKGDLETFGHWRGIKIQSPSSKNVLKYVEIVHAGNRAHYWDGQSAVWVSSKNNGNLTFKNCEIHHNKDWGLTVIQSKGATVTPSTEKKLESQNNFHDNGLASSPKCSDCDIQLN